jgi:hypothetical protein
MALTPSEKKRKRREAINFKQKIHAQRDWSKYEYEISEFVDKKKLPKSDTAIGIAAATRPEYFEKTVQSIASNPEVEKIPTFLFLDCHPDRRQSQITAQHKVIAKKHLPHCVVVERPVNFGCGRNLIDLRRQLFDVLGYEKVFVLEDDCIIAKNYFKYTQNLLDWADENYSNVGIAQGHNFCVMSSDVKKKHLAKVSATGTNLWAYLMKKECWDSISETLYKFESHYLTAIEYMHRPHKAIRDWFRVLSHDGSMTRGDSPVPLGKTELFTREKFCQTPPTGQDAATNISFWAAGWERVAPVVNRTLYIGKHGIHYTPEQFEADGFGNHALDHYARDGSRKKFEMFLGTFRDLVKPSSEVSGINMVEA